MSGQWEVVAVCSPMEPRLRLKRILLPTWFEIGPAKCSIFILKKWCLFYMPYNHELQCELLYLLLYICSAVWTSMQVQNGVWSLMLRWIPRRVYQWHLYMSSKYVSLVNPWNAKNEDSWLCDSVDQDEAAHNEPPHLGLHCLHSNVWIFNITKLGRNSFRNFADVHFDVFFFGVFRVKRFLKHDEWTGWYLDCHSILRHFQQYFSHFGPIVEWLRLIAHALAFQ